MCVAYCFSLSEFSGSVVFFRWVTAGDVAISRPKNNNKHGKYIGELTIDRDEPIFADGCVPFRSVQ